MEDMAMIRSEIKRALYRRKIGGHERRLYEWMLTKEIQTRIYNNKETDQYETRYKIW
jgi:hypothetical protein